MCIMGEDGLILCRKERRKNSEIQGFNVFDMALYYIFIYIHFMINPILPVAKFTDLKKQGVNFDTF